jgi:hypothetical protein
MTYLRLEVKICEGCGALWLRRSTDGVYCFACSSRLASFPVPTGKHRGGRPRLPRAKNCTAAHRRTEAGAQ